jgi:hypothetical protein
MPKGSQPRGNQLWKVTIRFMFADDILHAVYFIWSRSPEHAIKIVKKIVQWPPFEAIEAELLDIHSPHAEPPTPSDVDDGDRMIANQSSYGRGWENMGNGRRWHSPNQ